MTAYQVQPVKAVQSDHRVRLSGISWETYERMMDESERAGRHLWLTYDNGELEIEMPVLLHEVIKEFVSSLLTIYLIETGTPWVPLGRTTYKRPALGKSLESDGAYYFNNVNDIERCVWNPEQPLPPPDLAIEVTVAQPLMDKFAVYAAIGVDEVWHVLSDGLVHILRLEEDRYVQTEVSRALPRMTAETLTYWVQYRLQKQENMNTLRAFQRTLSEGSAHTPQ